MVEFDFGWVDLSVRNESPGGITYCTYSTCNMYVCRYHPGSTLHPSHTSFLLGSHVICRRLKTSGQIPMIIQYSLLLLIYVDGHSSELIKAAW